MTRPPRLYALIAVLVLCAAMAVVSGGAAAASLVDLDVDTNRNGVVEDVADESGEDQWSETSGAIFAVNYDDDDGNHLSDTLSMNQLDGVPTGIDTTINGEGDVADITELVVRMPFDREDVQRAVLFVPNATDEVDWKAMHLFGRIAPDEEKIWGGPGEGAPGALITDHLTYPGEATLGLEGLFFRWMRDDAYGGTFPDGFDGIINLRLHVFLADGSEITDDVALKVAPFIITPNTQPAIETWEYEAGALIPGSRGTGGGNQWTQDHVEMGYTQAPGRPAQHMVFRLPYARTESTVLPSWPSRMLGPGTGTFLLQRSFGAGSGDYGGNLEVVPPTSAWPLGRVLVGNTMSDELYGFLADQQVQTPFPKDTADTSWLAVGHVDELFGFVPDGDGYAVVHADPHLARDMLDDFADDAVFFATGETSTNHDLVASGFALDALLDEGVDFGGDYAFAKYLRIYDGTGAGQVARVAPGGLDDGRIMIDRVWNTPRNVVLGPVPAANSVLGCELPCVGDASAVNSAGTWFMPPDATSRYVLFEGTKQWYPAFFFTVPTPPELLGLLLFDGQPAAISVKEVRDDVGLWALNDRAQQTIRHAIDVISAGMGAEAPEFRAVPDIFMTIDLLDEKAAVAMTPGAANLQPVNGVTYVPADFGPVDTAGVHVFEETIAHQIPGPEVFVDDWDLYHRLLGEVHCGTNVKREAFAPWW